MLEVLCTPDFWIAASAIALFVFGMGMLKKHLKKIACRCAGRTGEESV